MHPKIIRHEASSCPICGMDLVKQKIIRSKENSPVVQLDAQVIQKLGVKTKKVEKGRLFKYIKTVGYVTYDEQRVKTITAPANGWVENLSVRRAGLQVKKGQLMMELYSPDFVKVQKEFIAAQKKDKSGILKKYGQRQESVDARDHLRYMGISDSLANEIARTGKPRYRIPIYSKQHGNIIRHNVHKHQYVWDGQPMFTVADLSSVWVEANVYEHQLDWIKRKQSVEVKVQALPGKSWKGMVTYIFPELDGRTRTLKVRIRVMNYDSELKPNMFAQVEIFGGAKQNVLKISRQALIVTGKRESVILDKGDGQFQPVDVVSGMHSQGMVEILSGLKEDDQVVVSGQFLIDSEANLQASFSRFTD
ncbi:MAG: efflux RND transporter periplasmic adaptor subunit, partial [Gammaproteobacteria bacterium]|nr:efflux RND transporter periplasmic adaptor subunit [Gammaproteobacteria bacterium]